MTDRSLRNRFIFFVDWRTQQGWQSFEDKPPII
jgi:hypothetical protein